MILINWYVNSDSFWIRKLRIASAVWWCLAYLPIEDRVQSHILRLEPDPVPVARRNHAQQVGGQGLGPQSRPAGVSPPAGRAWQHPGRGLWQKLGGAEWGAGSSRDAPSDRRGPRRASGAPPAECPFPDSSFLHFSPGLGGQLGGRGTRPGSRRGAAPEAPARECICPCHPQRVSGGGGPRAKRGRAPGESLPRRPRTAAPRPLGGSV